MGASSTYPADFVALIFGRRMVKPLLLFYKGRRGVRTIWQRANERPQIFLYENEFGSEIFKLDIISYLSLEKHSWNASKDFREQDRMSAIVISGSD